MSLTDILTQITGIAPTESKITVVFVVIAALLACFFGYRLLRLWVSVIGFLIGFAVAGMILVALSAPALICVIVSIAVGVVGGLISFKFYKIGAFILAAVSFYSLVTQVASAATQGQKMAVILIGVVVGIIAGVLAVKFIRPMSIFSTALGGGLTAGEGVCLLLGITNAYIALGTGVVVMILGIFFQIRGRK